jgi:hypothetical protein
MGRNLALYSGMEPGGREPPAQPFRSAKSYPRQPHGPGGGAVVSKLYYYDWFCRLGGPFHSDFTTFDN